MKALIILVAAFVIHPLSAEVATPANPFLPIVAAKGKPTNGPDSQVSRIDLDSHQNLGQAVKQIIAGLPEAERSALIVDIPDAELANMRMKKNLRILNTPLPVALKYLSENSSMGYRMENNVWHICKERADDVIVVKYRASKAKLEQLGIVFGPSQTFTTKGGRMWPPQGEWDATYVSLTPGATEKEDEDSPWKKVESGVLQLRAERHYQEEFAAILLLKSRGYEGLSLEH